jgi:hypothetical protein
MRPHQKRLWPCFALLLLLPPALGAPGARPRRPYDGDRRLQRAVELPPVVGLAVPALVAKLAEATGVPLKCDRRLREVPAALALQPDTRASEAMEALESATGAVWVRQTGSYALVEAPEALPWCLLEDADIQAAIRTTSRNLAQSLTPEQRRRLGEGERLLPGDLTGRQREGILVLARCYVAREANWRPEAVGGRGVWLKLNRDPVTGDALEVWLPDRTWGTNEPAAGFPLDP